MEIKKTSIIDNNDSLFTGFNELDNLIGQLNTGLYVIGARPGMGKTSFLLNIIANMIANIHTKNDILFVSTNDSKQINLERLTSIITKIPIRVIQNDEFISDQQTQILEEHPILKKITSKLNLLTLNRLIQIDEVPNLFKQSEEPVSILMIDHLQDFINPENGIHVDLQVEHIMKMLKSLATQENIPIFITSNIERSVEQRKGNNKMPLTKDLNSKEIEKHAEVLIFLTRPEYYKIIDRNKEKTFANISVAKNNFGSIGEFELATEMDKLLFKNK
jgi:replicative DNA helicase